MKKILFILAFVYTIFSYGQGGPKVDAIKFKGDVTTTVRDAIDVPVGETWLIYNVTTDKVEFASSDDVWHDLTQLPLIDDNNLATATSTNVASASSVKNYVDFYAVELTGGSAGNRSADFAVMDTGTGVSGFQIVGGNDQAQVNGGVVGADHTLVVGPTAIWSLSQTNSVIDTFGPTAIVTRNYTDTNYISKDSIVDSDTFASVSPTTVPSSESVKAYVDASISGSGAVPDDTGSSNGDVLTTDGAGTYTWQTPSSGSSPPFDDNSAHIRDNLDNTKTITIVADNITTATNRNLTMPDADVNLGNMVTTNTVQSITGQKSFISSPNIESEINFNAHSDGSGSSAYSEFGVDANEYWYLESTEASGIFAKLNLTGLTAERTFVFPDVSGTVALTSNITDDQTASEVNITDSGANYTGTTVEAALTEIADSLAVQITSDITGVTGGTAIKNMYFQTEAGQDTDGDPPAGVASLCIDCSPAKVVATATIAMDGWKMYDDQTADAATITLSDCDPGETLTVYINRASAPTLAGTGLTFNQLPNTTAFASATQMMIIFEVAYDGTTIDYYYVER